jgi:2-oxoglutarate ferredoxin oxidoreductase subunit delta
MHGFTGGKLWGSRHSESVQEKDMGKEKLKELQINRDWCKGCGICVEFCGKKVLELDELDKAVAVRPEDCVMCRLCEMRCPDLAISLQAEDDAAS